MNDIKARGNEGEERTARYLKEKGYIITKRNYHSRFGEIDIIAENEDTIAFVEVKTRKANSVVLPSEAVDVHKQRKIIATAEQYLSIANTDLQPRFDVSQVTVYGSGLREEYKIEYLENAF